MHSFEILEEFVSVLKKDLTFVLVVVKGGRYFDVPPITISKSGQIHSFGVPREGNFPEDADMWPPRSLHISSEAFNPCNSKGEEVILSGGLDTTYSLRLERIWKPLLPFHR